MSADLEIVLAKVHQLNLEELLTVQEQIIRQVRVKVVPPEIVNKVRSEQRVQIPGAYQFSSQEIETELAEVFSPEELAIMDKVDLNNLPVGSKTVTQMLSEDRRDRF